MSLRSRNSLLGAAFLAAAGAFSPAVSQAAFVVFDQILTTNPPAVANPNVGDFANCLAIEGCFGHSGLVDTIGGNLPDTLTFTFSLSPAQVASITGGPGALATFSVTASRDIGHKAGDQALDVIGVTGDNISFGNLFSNTIDSCPTGERGSPGYPADLVCGPNFHTDVTATDSLTVGTANITSMAADGTIQFVLNPTDSIGRLKIFSVQLQVTQVPEPSSFAVFAAGIVLLGFVLRANKNK